jgi:fibronectin type 3 domain-containing protein
MRRGVVTTFIVLLFVLAAQLQLDGSQYEVGPPENISTAAVPQDLAIPPDIPTLGSDLEGYFTENLGQISDPGIRFYAPGDPLSVGLTVDGIVFALFDTTLHEGAGGIPAGPGDRSAVVFSMTFEGCSPCEPVGTRPLGFSTNVFSGADPARWVRDARSFSEVMYEGLYGGVDLRLYFVDGLLKYDLILDQGMDAERIVLRYEGVDSLEVDAPTGDLLILTALGMLRDSRPVIFDDEARGGEGILSDFTILGDRSVGFDVPDGALLHRPIVIDPGLQFSTFFGGRNRDMSVAITLDDKGNIVVAGDTQSVDFPTTPGVYDGAGNTTLNNDTYVAMFDPSGSDLIFSTFVCGEDDEGFLDVMVGPDGYIYVAGGTYSKQFPMVNALDDSYGGGEHDGVLLKLSPDGRELLFSTYIGGVDLDYIRSIHVDGNGDVFIAGPTGSGDLPTTAGAFCTTYVRTHSYPDAMFCMKLDSTLSRLIFSTYVNGLSLAGEGTTIATMSVGSEGNPYLVSSTTKTNFLPKDEGGYCMTRSGNSDTVVLKLDPTGSEVLNWTYVGGSNYDKAWAVDLGVNDTVYVTGWTISTDFPTTSNAFSRTLSGSKDVFLYALDSNLSTLEYGTYFGGDNFELGGAIHVSKDSGAVFVYLVSNSGTLPTTPGCICPISRSRVDAGALVIGFNTSDHSLIYSTYVPGMYFGAIGTRAIYSDPYGNVYLGGGAPPSYFVSTEGAYCTTFNGGPEDAFLMKIDPRPVVVPPSPPQGLDALSGDGYVSLSWNVSKVETAMVLKYRLYRGDYQGNETPLRDFSWEEHVFTDSDVENGKDYYYAISAVSSAGEGPLSESVPARPLGAPGVPYDFDATTGDRLVHLSWSSPNDTGGEILGYHLFRGFTPDALVHFKSFDANTTDYVDSEVEPGTFYFYTVRAFNGKGNGDFAEPIHLRPVGPPTRPRDFTVEAGNGQVSLSWSVPTTDGGFPFTAYRVYRGNSPYDILLLEPTLPTNLSFLDTPLVNGMTYYYYVTAVTELDESPPTETLDVMPYGPPGQPRKLIAKAGDGQVSLSWSSPIDHGGRRITGYNLYFGKSPESLLGPVVLEDELTHVQGDLTNGETYYFRVHGVNEAGEGLGSELANATPVGPPGLPRDLSLDSVPDGILVSWGMPDDTGGAESITIRIFRGPDTESFRVIDELADAQSFLDVNVTGGTTYFYWIQAISGYGDGPETEALEIYRTTPPDAVVGLEVQWSDQEVLLTWTVPAHDGGSTIIGYVVHRGDSEANLEEHETLGVVLSFTDTGLVNGRTYHYAIFAVNSVGPGDRSDVVSSKPRGPPGLPIDFEIEERTDRIILTWKEPALEEGRAPVVGYRVLRGTSVDDLQQLVELGLVLRYVDVDVEEDTTYFYSVRAMSEVGPGIETQIEPASVSSEPTLSVQQLSLLILLVVGLVLVFGIWYGMRSRRREEAPIEPVATEEIIEEVAEAPEAVVAAAEVPEEPTPYIVEEVFVVFRDGRLIADCAREERRTRDADLMSGMLIAVQGILQDGLQRGQLESIKYGENLIILARGRHINLAAVVYGQPGEDLKEELETTIGRIESSYAGVIEKWIGDLEVFSGVEEMVAPLLASTHDLTREDVAGVKVEEGVSLLSAVDFHRGYVRLKVAAVNSTDELIADASMDVHYNPDMLRLERVEPDTLPLKGDRVTLGNVRPGERTTVAFLFDPQICQGTHIDGNLMYYDAKGQIQRVEMKRRTADVVCPVFFTREHANTAMLRKLIKEKLPMTDLRFFSYPEKLSPSRVLEIGKLAIVGGEIQLVREYIEEGPPYYSEVWYYGETKAKGIQMVMRLGVVERKQALEFFVASTAMEPVTGLIAEFRRELEGVMGEKYGGEVVMEPERDEGLRRDLEGRELLIYGEDEESQED